MSLRKNRENTFRIDFSNIPKKPTFKEIHKFVARDLGLSVEQVCRIQISHIYNCAFVQTVDLATAQDIVQLHDNRHEYECNKQRYKLRILMEDGCIHVKLHDLSMDITDEQVEHHMSQYGEVASIQELVWTDDYEFAGLPTGIRQVKMILKHPIKSFICICGESTYVTYPGQRPTCKHCGEYTHTGIPCVQNKKLLVQKASVNERLNVSPVKSYAGVVKQGPLASTSSNNHGTNAYEISDGEEEPTTDTSGTANTSTNPAEQAEYMEVTVAEIEPQATNTDKVPSQISGGLPTAEDAVFKPPITPNTASSCSGHKHKRDDGNTTDDSTASNSSKKDRKQNKKHYKLRNTDTGIE